MSSTATLPKGLTADILSKSYRVQDLFKAKQYAEAEAVNAEIIATGFQDVSVFHTAGTLAFRQGRPKESIAQYRRALAINPMFRASRDQLIVMLDCDPDTTALEAQYEREVWWRCHGRMRRDLPNDRTPDRPLRVGYVSADFCRHSARHAFGPVVLGHSNAIQPFYYSSTVKADAITGEYSTRQGWRDMTGFADEVMAQQIIADQIDVLVDLSGYTPGNRLGVFAMKPAPVTVTAWGYATGLGWPRDWNPVLFADTIVLPWSMRGTDQVVDLPCVLTYDGPDGDISPLPCLTKPPTFGVFQRQMKINDAFVNLCQQVLKRLPEARLVFKGDYSDAFIVWLLEQFSDLRERVTVFPVTSQLEHLQAYRDIDLCLDTFPQTGGVTTCEALSMGVPCVTLIGDRVIQRTSASILTSIFGTANHFIAHTPDEYVDYAVQWVTTGKEILGLLRHELPERLADSRVVNGYVPAVEQAYRNLWQEYCEAA